MRELRKAASEGWHPFIASLAHFPKRNPFLIAGVAGALVLIFLGVNQYQTERDVNILRPQVTRIIQTASACKRPITPRRSELCAERIRIGLEACRENAECQRAFAEVLKPLEKVSEQTRPAKASGPEASSSPEKSGPSPQGGSPVATDGPSHPNGGSVPDQSPTHHAPPHATHPNAGSPQGGGGEAAPSNPPASSNGGEGGSASATVTVEGGGDEGPGASDEGHEAAGGNPVGEGVGHAVEGVGAVVQETGEAANGLVEGVGCKVLGSC